MAMPSYKIAICGAGTTGLASAAFLARDGHQVQIFERFAEAQPLGAGFMLQPTGLACLARLGLDKAAIAYGRRIARLHGETLKGRTILDLGYEELAPHLFAIGVHRAALFQVLHDHVIEQGVPITCASEVVDSRRIVGGRTVVDKTGTTHGPFDLVIDATGMRSALRDRYARVTLDTPYPFGAVWGVAEEPADWSFPQHLRQRYNGAAFMAGILPIGRRPDDDRQLTAVFWSLPTARADAWRAAGLDVWRQEFLRFWPAAEPFLSQFKHIDELTFATYADVALQYPYADRLLFIGDAAHAGSPQLGQGANLGLIDAMTLADALQYSDGAQAALHAYARMRKPQTSFYQRASRVLTPFFQSHSRLAGGLRDLAFGPMARIPFARGQMLRTLSGVKTGLLTALDPGDWNAGYALKRPPPDRQLAPQD